MEGADVGSIVITNSSFPLSNTHFSHFHRHFTMKMRKKIEFQKKKYHRIQYHHFIWNLVATVYWTDMHCKTVLANCMFQIYDVCVCVLDMRGSVEWHCGLIVWMLSGSGFIFHLSLRFFFRQYLHHYSTDSQ